MSLFYAYRVATRLLGPVLGLYLQRRKKRGKEDAGRIGERFGHASALRPRESWSGYTGPALANPFPPCR